MLHAYDGHAYEMHANEVHTHNVHALRSSSHENQAVWLSPAQTTPTSIKKSRYSEVSFPACTSNSLANNYLGSIILLLALAHRTLPTT